MSTWRVYVTGDDPNDVPVGAWFTIEAEDDVDAANEAVDAARDCGWTNTSTTRVILSDYRAVHTTASERIRTARSLIGESIATDVRKEARDRQRRGWAADRIKTARGSIAGELAALELGNLLEPGRSMIRDHIAAALDELDHATDALRGEES